MNALYVEFIEECRKSGIPPKQAAKEMGINWDTVRRWQKRDPSKSNAETIQKYLTTLRERRQAYTQSKNEDVASKVAYEEREVTVVNENTDSGAEETEKQPLLSETELKELLTPHEIIRDPVHQDIWITALERAIIDTPAFQRLRNLYQLGPTHLVYPGATHNRLSHSLGTLYCVEDLIQIINRNFRVYEQPSLMDIKEYPHLLVRLCALLHDVAHMPFGHTIEKEGNLIDDEWNDKDRVKLWLYDDSERSISATIRNFLVENGIDKGRVELVLKDVREYIVNIKNPMEYEYPYICDIVGNTLCADLLDYLERDMYYCGLKERSGDRVIKYVAVMRLISKKNTIEEFEAEKDITRGEGKGRVVLLAYRFEREHGPGGRTKPVIKNEILSEAIDLLRRRFALAEKVYFHRTKIAASAMLISATESSEKPLKEFYTIGETEFIRLLEGDKNERCVYLIQAYKDRRLYKPVYKIEYIPEDESGESRKLWNEIYDEYRDGKKRVKREEEIEYLSNLPHGSIVIYCPDKRMNTKEFEMLVHYHPEGDVKKLEGTLEGERQDEMKAINKRFQKLWKLEVFVDPKALDVSKVSNPDVQSLATLCEGIIEFPNSILELRQKGLQLPWQIARRAVKEYERETNKEVSTRIEEQLIQSVSRGASPDIIKTLKDTLYTLMETQNKEQGNK